MKKDDPKKMEVKPALALPDGLELVTLERIDDVLTMTVVSTQESPCCPRCSAPATRVHSRYTRQVADLPCSGQHVRLLVQMLLRCARLHTKNLCRASDALCGALGAGDAAFVSDRTIIGLATGGRPGVRVTDRLGIETTRQTILRRIMALPTEPVGQVTQIGIDDFSFRRGRKFGTIVVDVQTHKVLDGGPPGN